MRFLHVASTLAAGGIASSLGYVLPALARQPGVSVDVMALYEAGQWGEHLLSCGLGVGTLGLGHKYAPLALPRLATLIHRGGYDVVHVHGWPALLFCALAGPVAEPVTGGSGAALVWSEHNVTNRRRRPIFRPLDRLMYRSYRHLVAVSEQVAAALVAWLPETVGKLSVVHNGVDPALYQASKGTRGQVRRALGIAPGVPLLLSVGGLHPRKGNDLLLDAFHRLAAGSRDPRPTLLICGDGGSEADLRAQAARLDLLADVHFLGYRHDVPALMAAADVLVVASRWEGCPMVVLEAMAAGLPVVATTVGGVPELIEDGVSGCLVPPEDVPALAVAIERTLAHPDDAAGMAAQARRRVQAHFTADVAARKLMDVYRQAVADL